MGCTRKSSIDIEPTLSAKPRVQRPTDEAHHQNDDVETVPAAKARNVAKIHAVNAGEKGERNENRADDGQRFRDVVR